LDQCQLETGPIRLLLDQRNHGTVPGQNTPCIGCKHHRAILQRIDQNGNCLPGIAQAHQCSEASS
jgi:hypothetical protein